MSNSASAIAYASRMKYLQDDTDQRPDPMFLSRQQSQRHRGRSLLAVSDKQQLKNGSSSKDVKARDRRKSRRHSIRNNSIDLEQHYNAAVVELDGAKWVKKIQAGCWYWQNENGGECYPDEQEPKEQETLCEDDESLAYPPSFSCLDVPAKPITTRSKIELLKNGQFPKQYASMCRDGTTANISKEDTIKQDLVKKILK